MSTGIVFAGWPGYVTVICWGPLGTFCSRNSPPRLVLVPIEVPTTLTWAPIRYLPLSGSRTTPVTAPTPVLADIVVVVLVVVVD